MKIISDNYDVDENHKVFKLKDESLLIDSGTIFGIVISGVALVNERIVLAGEFFTTVNQSSIKSFGNTVCFHRNNWVGKQIIGGAINPYVGDVRYINGCTDSLLVCPPKLGDPCLNALYFPPYTEQTFHTHPSIRLGCVMFGNGTACLDKEELELETGSVFSIKKEEIHRFKTNKQRMLVIAYHPDSDWGPTDEKHPMINKTILIKNL